MTENFRFKQANYLNALPANRQFSKNGICAVLSAAWLRVMRESKEDGPGKRKAALELIAKGGGSVAQQAYSKAWNNKSDVVANSKFVIRVAGQADIAEELEGSGAIPYDLIVVNIADLRKRGIQFHFGYSRGAHAVAFWRSGKDSILPSGHFYFFDPNFGEYKGDKGEISEWFDTFISTHYGTISWWYLLLLKPVEGVQDGVRVM